MRSIAENTDTIAAIATAVGNAGIGIVRMSGNKALFIADRLFVSKDGRAPSQHKTYTLHYGWIVDPASPDTSAGMVDEVLLSVMRAPRSYTKEDVVEISCHGGAASVRRILMLILEHGGRMAEAGEFTKRAFLNGRIDLTQAEAVADIVRAQTERALSVGVRQLKGALCKRIDLVRQKLLPGVAALEASIDFVEEDGVAYEKQALVGVLTESAHNIAELIDEGKVGALLRDGMRVVICGRANVGKSSLLNALVKHERSIVTHIAGTTRDTVEEIIDIRGVPMRFIDTAGILKPRDLLDKKALGRTQRSIRTADVIVMVFDGSRRLQEEDRRLLRAVKQQRVIALVNKSDLRQRIEKDVLTAAFQTVIHLCAKQGTHLDILEDALMDMVFGGASGTAEVVFALNQRHRELLRASLRSLRKALVSVRKGLSEEFISEDVKEALACLDMILGRRCNSDLLDRIFSEFCIGK